MARKSPKPDAEVPVPADMDEAAEMIAEIGKLERQLKRAGANLEGVLAKVNTRAKDKAKPHHERISTLTAGLKKFCADRRAELTDNGKRQHIEFTSGECTWTKRPPRVSVRGGDDKAIILLKAHGLEALIRVKETIDRNAIRADPPLIENVKTITVGSAGEDFEVKPFAPTDLTAVKS